MSAAVYVQTNNATENEVIVFSRAEDGALAPVGRYPTGGRGTGVPHLASAGSVVLGDDGQWLLVVNAGSDELSLFAVQPDGLQLADRVGSGGSKPTSVAVSGALVYVLNNWRKHLPGANRGVDGCSSGKWFTGWTDHRPDSAPPLPAATQWLLTTGWRRRGLIQTREAPRAQFLFD